MKPPTLKFTNNCQLAVMRLDRLSEQSSSKTLHVSSCQITPTPTEFLLSSPKSPSIGLSSVPSKNLPERKPPLACLFCRGRKIACGPPLPGSTKKTCKSVALFLSLLSHCKKLKKKNLANVENDHCSVIIHLKVDGE